MPIAERAFELPDLVCRSCGASGYLVLSHRRIAEAPLRIIGVPMYRCSICHARHAYFGKSRIAIRDVYIWTTTLFMGLVLLIGLRLLLDVLSVW